MNRDDIQTIEITSLQLSQDGTVLTGGIYDEDDANEATVFTPGGEVVMRLVKTSRGNWRFESSDFLNPSTHARRLRFRDVSQAVKIIANTCRVTIDEAQLF